MTKKQSFINEGISFSGGYGDQLTFKGGALLTIGGLNANGSPENSVTVDGAKLQVNSGINIYGSGNNGSDEVFQLTNGASVNCGGGVFCRMKRKPAYGKRPCADHPILPLQEW